MQYSRFCQCPYDEADSRSCTRVHFDCERAGGIQLWIRFSHCITKCTSRSPLLHNGLFGDAVQWCGTLDSASKSHSLDKQIFLCVSSISLFRAVPVCLKIPEKAHGTADTGGHGGARPTDCYGRKAYFHFNDWTLLRHATFRIQIALHSTNRFMQSFVFIRVKFMYTTYPQLEASIINRCADMPTSYDFFGQACYSDLWPAIHIN
jgi:hypothetical protein